MERVSTISKTSFSTETLRTVAIFKASSRTDENIDELKMYFDEIINWINSVFKGTCSEMDADHVSSWSKGGAGGNAKRKTKMKFHFKKCHFVLNIEKNCEFVCIIFKMGLQ